MIIAHRGSSEAAPENTVAAAMLAWQQNADAVEVDIHLSKDNRIMVIHDKTTERTAGVDLKVSETDSADLRKLDAGSHKGEKWAGQKIPFLDEIIETVPSNKKLFIELKSDAKTLPHLKRIIDQSAKADQLIIIGFDLENMAQMKKLTPQIPVYWLKAANKDEATEEYIPYDPDIIAITRDNGLDALNLFYKGMTKDFAAQAAKAQLPLYTWTVDDPDIARKMKKLRIRGITTNVPRKIRDAL
jgi:glycerophosphoryl diester phosphodiesterase